MSWAVSLPGIPCRKENRLYREMNRVCVRIRYYGGGLVPVGSFIANIGSLSDAPVGQHYRPLARPIEALTWAQCRQGTLYASTSLPAGFEEDAMGTYHQLDYALFYMNIFNNAKLRSTRHLTAANAVRPGL